MLKVLLAAFAALAAALPAHQDELQLAASAVIEGHTHLQRAARLQEEEQRLSTALATKQKQLENELQADEADNERAAALLAAKGKEVTATMRQLGDTDPDAQQFSSEVCPSPHTRVSHPRTPPARRPPFRPTALRRSLQRCRRKRCPAAASDGASQSTAALPTRTTARRGCE